MKEFARALSEVVGTVSTVDIKEAYKKFIKSRNWDKLHPIYKKDCKMLVNPVPTMDKDGYMQFFNAYNKFANDVNNKHLNLSLI